MHPSGGREDAARKLERAASLTLTHTASIDEKDLLADVERRESQQLHERHMQNLAAGGGGTGPDWVVKAEL